VKVVRTLDWIVPRSHALVRHRAERYDPSQVFDIGFVLNRNRYAEIQRELIRDLDEDPADSAAAIELGQILFRRGLLDEAERYFHQALLHRDNLPDYGKLAARQLRYIRQKKEQRKRTKPAKSQT
jgi:lipopolysaccharide biosynthesis regulator YciM